MRIFETVGMGNLLGVGCISGIHLGINIVRTKQELKSCKAMTEN